MIYLQLFWEFLKIGLFAVGGGMATLPFLQRLSESSGWFPQSLITDMVAISESTPGPIGINMATPMWATTWRGSWAASWPPWARSCPPSSSW